MRVRSRKLDIKLTQKIIKDRCGTISFKKGETFFRGNRVAIESYEKGYCEAKVYALENFNVIIKSDGRGGFYADCSCPKLASFQKDCQHIAAVLHAIYHQQEQIYPNKKEESDRQEQAPHLFSFFEEQALKTRTRQMHFDQRKILQPEYLLKLIQLSDGTQLIGAGIKLEAREVEDIRGFLEDLKTGGKTPLFNPSEQCFRTEDDAVLQQFIQIAQDERIYSNNLSKEWDRKEFKSFIIIPPSSWEKLLPMLDEAPVTWEHTNEDFKVAHAPLSLKFILAELGEGRYQLALNGLDKMSVLKPYRSVLVDGTLTVMNMEDFGMLLKLTQMIERSGSKQLPISKEQLSFFLDKIVPNLRNLGEVEISPSISAAMTNIPLAAKLFLDRVGNRLLAGLEFHYENIMINPLEKREDSPALLFTRDRVKEDAILKLMEDAKFSSSGQGYFLQNEKLEYDFLVHTIPKLEKLVQIYATTAVRNRIYKGKNFPKIRVRIKKERSNWLEFKFEMDGIPDKEIREVLQALEEKRKYYRLRNGTLLSLETREYEEIQRFLKAVPKQEEEFDTLITMPTIRGLPYVHQDIFKHEESFSEFLMNLQHPGKNDVAIPDSINEVLHDYQKVGYKWMKTLAHYGFGGILADDMGLGKTIQAIAYIISELLNIRGSKKPILVVSPSSLTYQWLGELLKFAPEVKAQVIDGNKAKRFEIQKRLKDEKTDVYITSYPILRRDIKWFEKQKFHTIFFDEAQAFKNPYTQTAKTVKLLNADHRFALTGTPVENSLEELWAIFHVVFPELFLGLKEYSELSRMMISKRIRPFLLRRLKEDVLSELPEKQTSIEVIDLLPEQKKLYAAYLAKLRHDTLKHLDKDTLRKNRIKILAGLTRLRQICCHPALFVHDYQGSSAKFEQLQQIIKESQQAGRKVLIFSQFTKMLQLIGRELAYKGVPFFYLDGQTPVEERLETCQRYNSGERSIFLISLKAGGTGLNLTGADTVILYDNWWNPAVEEQAEDRAHRIGQKKAVEVIKLVARGTIEEKMNELQEKKRLLIHETIDVKSKEQYTLTEEDIREIFNI